MRTSLAALSITLSLLMPSNQAHASAAETLNAQMPRTIHQAIRYNHYLNRPLLLQERCKFVMYCLRGAEQVDLELTLRFSPTPAPHYEISAATGTFISEGKRHPLNVRIFHGKPYVVSYGVDDLLNNTSNEHDGKWLLVGPEAESTSGTHANLVGQPRIDGEASIAGLLRRLQFVEAAMAEQALYNDPKQARELFRAVRSLRKMADYLDKYLLTELAPSMSLPEAIFEKLLAAESQELEQLAAQAVANPDGNCDIAIYDQLLMRARAWKAGSPAYFYELGRSTLSDAAMIWGIGLRQNVRNRIEQTAGAYCDPRKVASQKSQIEMILNQDGIGELPLK